MTYGDWVIISNNGIIFVAEEKQDAYVVYNIMTGNKEEIEEYKKQYGVPFVEKYTAIKWSGNLVIAEVEESRIKETEEQDED